MWFLLPSLPMFLLVPALLQSESAFWPALGLAVGMMALPYLAFFWSAPKLGIAL